MPLEKVGKGSIGNCADRTLTYSVTGWVGNNKVGASISLNGEQVCYDPPQTQTNNLREVLDLKPGGTRPETSVR